MKYFLIYISFLLFCSCAIKRLQRPTTAVDLQTGAEVEENSIHLEKGKICYLISAPYDGPLIDNSIFKDIKFANFFPANGGSIDAIYHGAASKSAKIDTVLHNNLIDEIALQEALMNCPIGLQYQYVPQQAFTDHNEQLNMLKVRNEYAPDIIINLKSISLKVSGDANTGYSEVRSEPRNVNYGFYATSSTSANSYGNILMDYTSVWEIENLKDHSTQRIKQTGRYVSVYYDGYSINEETMICARKIGKEFSDLFKNSRGYNL